jgi:diguanylate cyclase (GGDEF)-like protein
MSVRKKALAITGLTLGALVLVLWYAAQTTVMRGFLALERSSARRNMTRVRNALSNDLSTMLGTARDWSEWTDTYTFVQGHNPQYADSNLGDETLQPLRLSFMIFTNTSGRVVAEMGYDLEAQEPAAAPDSLLESLSADSLLVRHTDVEDSVAGIMLLREGPAQVVSTPIVTTEDEGPIQGALIVGRFLHAGQLAALSRRTQLSLALHRYDAADLPHDMRVARSQLSRTNKMVMRPLSKGQLAGYTLLDDIYGQPALIARATIPRDIYAQGRATMLYMLVTLLVATLVLGLASYALLELAVLRRLVRLSASVKAIGASQDSSARLTVKGRDELSVLAADINEMLTGIAHAQDVIRYQAHHDALTELPNRVLFAARLGAALTEARRNGQMLAVLLLDLDRFKMVNDTLGHDVGDRLLKEAGDRLRSCLRGEDIACRLGGDEFVALLPGITHRRQASSVASRILNVFGRPFHMEGHEMHVSTSIGISLFPADGEDPTVLLRKADTALYEAKQRGRNAFGFHTPELEGQAQERLTLENELHHALERGEFVLQYQPEFELETGRIIAVEALLRWRHPRRGLLDAGQFIAVAEEAGLIEPIGQWVIKEACAQAAAWHQEGLLDDAPRVAVNLSGREFHVEYLAEMVSASLEYTGLRPESLELEISEHAVMQNVERSIEIMRELSKQGVRITLDDFGLGHSSLVHVKQFPIDSLKIDRAFIRDVAADVNDQAIVQAIIAMARALGLTIVAEGVETEAQMALLRAWGCYAVQGYLLSPPLAAEAITELLAAHAPGGRPAPTTIVPG